MPRARFVVALAALLTLPAAVAAAQDRPAIFGEQLDVELVLVDLLAEDEEGRAVLDLTRDEIRVFEDGSPVEIVEFSAPAALRASGAGDGGGGGGAENALPGARIVVFVDNLHLGPLSRKRVFDALAGFMADGLGPRDEVMVVGYDGTVEVKLPMTTDRRALKKVLREQRELGAVSLMAGFDEERALQLLTERQSTETSGRRFLGDPCVDSGFIARTHAEQVHGRVQQSIGELERFVNSLAGYPGKKMLLHVSDGIPLKAGETVYRAAIELCDGTGFNKGLDNAVNTQIFGAGRHTRWDPTKAWAEIEEFDTTNAWTRLAAQANTYQVSFYTLQGSGGPLNRSSQIDGARIGADTEMAGRRNAQDTLFLLADETGGRAVLDGGAVEPAVQRMLDERYNAYQLAYSPPNPGDGRQHRIRVTTTRPGVELRFRRGYRSKTGRERIADAVLSSLFHDRQENPLGARVVATAAADGQGRTESIRLRIELPLKSLTLLPEEGAGRGLFSLYVAARTDDGRMTPVGSKTVPVRVAAGDESESYVYEVEIPLRGKRPVVAVAIRDDVGGTATYLRRTVKVEREL